MTAETSSLRQDRDRFVAFAFSAAELLIEADATLAVVYAVGANSQLVGRDAPDLIGTSLLALFTAGDRKLVRHALARLGPADRLEPISVRLGETGLPAVLGACCVPSAEGRVFVSLSKSRTRGLTALSAEARDEETGVWRQEQFVEVVSELVRQGSQERRSDQLTVLQIGGLDDLRARIGEEAVGELLSETSAYLRAQSLGGDAVGRIAEDKYGIVHDSTVSAESLTDDVDSLAKESDPSGIGVSLAKGCMNLAADGMSAEDIGRIINFSMQIFSEQDVGSLDMMSMSEAFDELVQATAVRLASLKQTVAQQDFHIAFQPIVALADRGVHHFEVLSRFPDTMRPAETVQFAEQVGLIEELDLTVCQFAITVIQERLARGDVLDLAINVSGRSLGSSIFLRLLNELLAQLNDNRANLLIEVTETARLENLVEARNILQQLRDHGHAICLDDFGSGAASFQYLQNLPVDFVKIDGSFVRGFANNHEDAAIIRSMLSLANELQVPAIAEMVETEEQAAGLRNLGVAFGQGWLFGKPQRQVPTTSLKGKTRAKAGLGKGAA